MKFLKTPFILLWALLVAGGLIRPGGKVGGGVFHRGKGSEERLSQFLYFLRGLKGRVMGIFL